MLGMNYQNIQSGLSTAFLDKNISSNVLYRPQFISNDYKNFKSIIIPHNILSMSKASIFTLLKVNIEIFV